MDDMFYTDENSIEIQYLCQKDKRFKKLFTMIGPISYKLHMDNPYAFLVHEIIEQMMSVKVANVIYDRLEDLCCGNINPEQINGLSNDDIRKIGVSNLKVQYIKGITTAVINEKLNFEELSHKPDKEIIAALTKFRGVGMWTAKMYLLFVLNRPDVLPFEDGAFLQSYRWLYNTDDCKPISVQKRLKKWSPYSSIAARYMYKALDLGLTKEKFHLNK